MFALIFNIVAGPGGYRRFCSSIKNLLEPDERVTWSYLVS